MLISEFWPTKIHHPCRPPLQCVCVCSPLPERSISHGLNAGRRGPGSSSWFLWTARDPAGWSTSSGGGHAGRSLRSTPHPLRCYPLAPSNETALKSGSFSLHRSAQRSQPDQCRAETSVHSPDRLTWCSGAVALDSPSLWVWTWLRCSWGWRVHQNCRRSWPCRRLSGPDWASREGGVSGFPKVLRFLALCIRQLSPLTSSRWTHYSESKSVNEGLTLSGRIKTWISLALLLHRQKKRVHQTARNCQSWNALYRKHLAHISQKLSFELMLELIKQAYVHVRSISQSFSIVMLLSHWEDLYYAKCCTVGLMLCFEQIYTNQVK